MPRTRAHLLSNPLPLPHSPPTTPTQSVNHFRALSAPQRVRTYRRPRYRRQPHRLALGYPSPTFEQRSPRKLSIVASIDCGATYIAPRERPTSTDREPPSSTCSLLTSWTGIPKLAEVRTCSLFAVRFGPGSEANSNTMSRVLFSHRKARGVRRSRAQARLQRDSVLAHSPVAFASRSHGKSLPYPTFKFSDTARGHSMEGLRSVSLIKRVARAHHRRFALGLPVQELDPPGAKNSLAAKRRRVV